ncbi:NAD-glutamate dehydrogenase domain-containing protein [Methylocaldum sp.]|uniref:NAD-glutamate dehydrogenase domain-containing protein n=1 Tax=Methylocaldum sp. TaxID=1969727 RepID=UPI002D44402C|nr:NAD-glutamate dehydrogenase domain-containing protein [Methylocaldum sp.]HYE34018.1 NAD-glutamate dehydrogenase domain-containing protein [Methylocaldum sp.]
MPWEHSFRTFLDQAAREFHQTAPSFPYEQAFSAEYRALVPPQLATRDAFKVEHVTRTGREAVDLWAPDRQLGDPHHRLQLYGIRERSLDEIIPILQDLNLRVVDQVQFRVEVRSQRVFIRSFSVKPAADGLDSLMPVKEPLLDAFMALLTGRAENDALNGLLLLTGLSWKEIDVFRAYRNYYFQIGSRFGRFRFHQALLNNPKTALLLFHYFESRFKPDKRWIGLARREDDGMLPIRMELSSSLNAVEDSNEDRILRDLFNLIDATLRTNFYRRVDQPDHFIALKISSLGVINMPAPRPLFEIYVHSALMEGIHLRGAKVARGGIRWSDRPDDFRSEILDLMKTQMIKNALIVPQGAKGGFVIKSPARDSSDRDRAAQEAYSTLIRGLLDLTDNLNGAVVTGPSDVVAHDDADPYLVVAADKGTARLSDRANVIAAEYGFWLGDAFASGGSHGYHHKKLGITARGAWECVKRHFRELGQDIDTQPFTAIGIGSMDGDVFGNGMLLSDKIRLRAAFSANHIFLDPNPDPVQSYRERRRLFDLPNSSWDSYDPALISAGGGVFRRDAKDIPLSPDVREWLGIRHATVDGEELIRLLLTASVDLLWLGGIGTYVKASAETHEDVGDKVNDLTRVDASQVKAKVVGEGANLGFTQLARIEYALGGGRINTDAVDNSGGVDLSDHEVNLKILMTLLQHKGLIADQEERDRWLAEMTEDVCRSVLANNYWQSLCLSLDHRRCAQDVEPFLELAGRLINAGLLDPAVESFPSRKEIAARSQQVLTRPELAILMAYAKLALKQALFDNTEFLSASWTEDCFAGYFPAAVRERFAETLEEHSLAKEITATVVCNTLINQAGVGFLVWVDELEPPLLNQAVRAYFLFDRVLDGRKLRHKICALDGRIAAPRQIELLLLLEGLLNSFCLWALHKGKALYPNPETVAVWRKDLAQHLDYLAKSLAESERPDYEQRIAGSEALGFTAEEARLMALLERLHDFPALVDLAAGTGEPLSKVAELNDAVADHLDLRRLIPRLENVKPRDRWERRVQTVLLERLRSGSVRFSRAMLRAGLRDPAAFFAGQRLQPRLAKLRRFGRELNESTAAAASLIPFTALVTALEALREACDDPSS